MIEIKRCSKCGAKYVTEVCSNCEDKELPKVKKVVTKEK